MKLKRAIAAIVLASAFAAPVAAGTFEDAVDAHARVDYGKAQCLIRPLANDGDASAQFNLGLIYITGHGVQQDNAAAALWFRKAAEQGHSVAKLYLGGMYAELFVPTCGSVYRRHRVSKERSSLWKWQNGR